MNGTWAIAVALLLYTVLFVGCQSQVAANPDAKRLYDDLLSTYNRLIRPVRNNTETVLVKLGLRLSQLIDLVSPAVLCPRSFRRFYDDVMGKIRPAIVSLDHHTIYVVLYTYYIYSQRICWWYSLYIYVVVVPGCARKIARTVCACKMAGCGFGGRLRELASRERVYCGVAPAWLAN